MPYLPSGRGRAAEYVAPVAVNWSEGYRLSRKLPHLPTKTRALSGTLDPLAFAIALAQSHGDEVLVDKIAEGLVESGFEQTAAALGERIAYYRGMLERDP